MFVTILQEPHLRDTKIVCFMLSFFEKNMNIVEYKHSPSVVLKGGSEKFVSAAVQL